MRSYTKQKEREGESQRKRRENNVEDQVLYKFKTVSTQLHGVVGKIRTERREQMLGRSGAFSLAGLMISEMM